METSGLKGVCLVLSLSALSLGRVSASPLPCGISMDVPAGVKLIVDRETGPLACQLRQENDGDLPFVNGISRMSWDDIKASGSGVTRRLLGFFEVSPDRGVKFVGRRAYVDGRSGYSQSLLKKPLITRRFDGSRRVVIAQSQLRVRWLRQVDDLNQAESTGRFDCVDAAISEPSGFAIVNWCFKSGDSEAKKFVQSVSGLKLLTPG